MSDAGLDHSKHRTREDVDKQFSDRSGIAGFFETLLRRFRIASYLVALTPLYVVGIFQIPKLSISVWGINGQIH